MYLAAIAGGGEATSSEEREGLEEEGVECRV
jgi:hypothetical protein